MELINKIKSRMGEFWWYSLLIFLAARSGDVVQTIISLWLVPKYVSQDDLGAVLPLTEATKAFALPFAILVIPLSRWLSIYMVRGDKGRLKSLLRWSIVGSGVALALMAVISWLLMPHFIKGVRVSEAGLPEMVLLAGLLTAVAPVFNNSLQGLKKFNVVALASFAGTPLRFIAMWVVMPIRALTGFMVGMAVAPFSQMIISWFGLRRELMSDVESVPFWRADGREMLRYTIPVAATMIFWYIVSVVQTMMVRAYIPDADNAAYYMIMRFSEPCNWVGLTLYFIQFPLIAETCEKGGDYVPLLKRVLWTSFLAGTAVSIVYAFAAGPMMSAVDLWKDYAVHAKWVALNAFRFTLCITIYAFITGEQAAGKFTYLWYLVPCVVIENVGVWAFNTFDCFAFLNPHTVGFLIIWFTFTVIVQQIIICFHIHFKKVNRR